MSVDPPRHLPPSPEERLLTVVTRMAGGSDAGATKFARPVQARPATTTGLGGSGGPVASATYRDPSTTVALGAIGNPSGLVQPQGFADAYFAYNGSDGIILLQAGWYQVSATAVVSGATAGDALRCFCYFTTPQTVEGTDIAAPGGNAYPVAMSLPFYDDGSGTVVQVAVENHTSANGTVGSPTIHLVAYG